MRLPSAGRLCAAAAALAVAKVRGHPLAQLGVPQPAVLAAGALLTHWLVRLMWVLHATLAPAWSLTYVSNTRGGAQHRPCLDMARLFSAEASAPGNCCLWALLAPAAEHMRNHQLRCCRSSFGQLLHK